tara:strand:- start:99 stop:485 length:387 start_codon:yes stop_codon:yes gene_type:complete
VTGPVFKLGWLLVDLGAEGIELAIDPADADRLRYRPVTGPTPLVDRLRHMKHVVLAALRGRYVPDGSDVEMAYVFGERLGIAEDLGLPTHVGSSAWLIAAGESLAIEHESNIDRRNKFDARGISTRIL